MHMGTNIVLIIISFGFVGMGLGAVHFCRRPQHAYVSVWFICFGDRGKIGTAVIPRHLFENLAGNSFYPFPRMVSGSPEVRFNFLIG